MKARNRDRTTDLKSVEDAICADVMENYSHIGPPSAPAPTFKTVPLAVIDSVLSLNRHYDRFVWPRVKRFEEEHPEVRVLADFLPLMSADPHEFLRRELDCDFDQRADILYAVADHLASDLSERNELSEMKKATAWAIGAHPRHYERWEIRGFSIAGFQYLRKLLGAQTFKPDVWLIRYVEDVAGAMPISKLQLVSILESCAKRLNKDARKLDLAIWEGYARG